MTRSGGSEVSEGEPVTERLLVLIPWYIKLCLRGEAHTSSSILNCHTQDPISKCLAPLSAYPGALAGHCSSYVGCGCLVVCSCIRKVCWFVSVNVRGVNVLTPSGRASTIKKYSNLVGLECTTKLPISHWLGSLLWLYKGPPNPSTSFAFWFRLPGLRVLHAGRL